MGVRKSYKFCPVNFAERNIARNPTIVPLGAGGNPTIVPLGAGGKVTILSESFSISQKMCTTCN